MKTIGKVVGGVVCGLYAGFVGWLISDIIKTEKEIHETDRKIKETEDYLEAREKELRDQLDEMNGKTEAACRDTMKVFDEIGEWLEEQKRLDEEEESGAE